MSKRSEVVAAALNDFRARSVDYVRALRFTAGASLLVYWLKLHLIALILSAAALITNQLGLHRFGPVLCHRQL